ncbi:MAG: 30S ribosomal protein S6 [Erysipelotrichales bacterium]|nr:30S ribosomal protein S6 [Erysipelotrichales bacterium]
MNKYEMMFIVKTTIDEAAVKTTVDNLKSIITSMKGEIIEEKDLGQKKLAYPINKEITGFYYVVDFNANNELITELDRKAKIDENVIRHMIISLEEE